MSATCEPRDLRAETGAVQHGGVHDVINWESSLSDVPAASAILDRLLHHAEVLAITGRSYRLQDSAKQHVIAPELYHARSEIIRTFIGGERACCIHSEGNLPIGGFQRQA